jgi:hypothetical protein
VPKEIRGGEVAGSVCLDSLLEGKIPPKHPRDRSCRTKGLNDGLHLLSRQNLRAESKQNNCRMSETDLTGSTIRTAVARSKQTRFVTPDVTHWLQFAAFNMFFVERL